MTFTPGPWKNLGSTSARTLCGIQTKRSYKVRIEVSGDNHEANGRLIAAAPDLYSALQLIDATMSKAAMDGKPPTLDTLNLVLGTARMAVAKVL